MSKLVKLYTLNMCTSLYINERPVELYKNKSTDAAESSDIGHGNH